MKELLLPDIYAQDIFKINYKKLKQRGIKCLLFDLDNTIAPINIKEPNNEIIELFQNLDNQGFKVIILSNATKRRIRPFKDTLNVDCAANSHKPFSFKYKKILKIYKYNKDQIAAIGDQLFTDIKGANKMEITSILVNPMSKREHINTKINRLRERKIFKKFKEKNIFERGVYYD